LSFILITDILHIIKSKYIYISKCFTAQNFTDPNDDRWCPDPAAVEKMIAKFPELSKYSPSEDWLSHAAERMAKKEEEAANKREARKLKRLEAEKDKSWTEGMAAAARNGETKQDTEDALAQEEKGSEEKGE
jgi:hypothetical protein